MRQKYNFVYANLGVKRPFPVQNHESARKILLVLKTVRKVECYAQFLKKQFIKFNFTQSF